MTLEEEYRKLTRMLDDTHEELIRLYKEREQVRLKLKSRGRHGRPDGSVGDYRPALDALLPGANKRVPIPQ